MTLPLLDDIPARGGWSPDERARIDAALAQVGPEWVALYRLTRPVGVVGGSTLEAWERRGLECRFRHGFLEVRDPSAMPPESFICCCGRHRGAIVTIPQYRKEHARHIFPRKGTA